MTIKIDGYFPLDWLDMEIKLGRFKHLVRRPTPQEIFERENRVSIEIEIDSDGSYCLPDPSADEEANTWLYDQIVLKTEGYNESNNIPAFHKSAVIQAIYRRDYFPAEENSPWDEQIAIIEEFTDGSAVRHIFRQPTENELRQYRRKMQSGSLKPGKRGRQTFRMQPTLRSAADFYDMWLIKIENATVSGNSYDDNRRPEFLQFIDPLAKRAAVQSFANLILAALQD